MRFIVQILTNALAIFLADYLIAGFDFSGDLVSLLIASLVLGLINFFVRPVLRLISAPLIIISLGLFIVVINIGLLWLLDYLIKELTITGLSAYFWGVLIISLVNIFVEATRKK